MRLTVLGGSAAGPNPGQGCSGDLVQSGPTGVVLDPGPGTLPELQKHVDYREIDAVVLTHLHADHWLDVVAPRFALTYNPIPARRTVPLEPRATHSGDQSSLRCQGCRSPGITLRFEPALVGC